MMADTWWQGISRDALAAQTDDRGVQDPSAILPPARTLVRGMPRGGHHASTARRISMQTRRQNHAAKYSRSDSQRPRVVSDSTGMKSVR